MAVSLCLSRKMRFRGSLGILAIAFSPCLTRKRLFQAPHHEAQEQPVGRHLGPLRLPFPSACRGKGNCRALWECSRWLFPPACRGKGAFRAPPGCPRAALYGCWAQALIPRGCIFPLPVEETSRSRLPGNAHDCLFPLPVEENVISGLPCEGKEWACSDGSGCQPAFASSDSPSSSKQIRAA